MPKERNPGRTANIWSGISQIGTKNHFELPAKTVSASQIRKASFLSCVAGGIERIGWIDYSSYQVFGCFWARPVSRSECALGHFPPKREGEEENSFATPFLGGAERKENRKERNATHRGKRGRWAVCNVLQVASESSSSFCIHGLIKFGETCPFIASFVQHRRRILSNKLM